HPGPVDVAEVVRHSAMALEPAAREAGLRLAVAGHAGPLMATADPERLAQVVANLVENAIKYAATTVEVAVRPALPPSPAGAAPSKSASPTTARASTPTTCPGSSSGSTPPAASRAARSVPGSAWPSS